MAKVSTQMVEYLKQNNIVPCRPKISKTQPTGGGWISKDTNLPDVQSDSQIQGSLATLKEFSAHKGGRSMSFQNTLHLKGNTNIGTGGKCNNLNNVCKSQV